MKNLVIIANGGAGGINFPHRRAQGLKKAVNIGYEILKNGGSSLDAVEKAIMILEDETIFNAGTGSTLGLTGEVEMDASIMTADGNFGAVAAIKNVRYPIQVARLIMEKTDHLLLCGDGALRFARLNGIKYHNPKTKEKERMWLRAKNRLKSDYFPRLYKLKELYETVGVVAMDKNGMIAVGTSTGGISLHLPGRVGDTPIIGAGTYANKYGGVSATGHGEMIMKTLLAFRTVVFMEKYSAPVAGKMAIDYATRNKCRAGLIGIDKHGRILCVNNTEAMSWCYIKDGNIKSFY
ncbi:MAG: isoaspartyl peptidase/L-asparaginase [candidate division WOR-3 bacterium]